MAAMGLRNALRRDQRGSREQAWRHRVLEQASRDAIRELKSRFGYHRRGIACAVSRHRHRASHAARSKSDSRLRRRQDMQEVAPATAGGGQGQAGKGSWERIAVGPRLIAWAA